jgi:hypothetical protein
MKKLALSLLIGLAALGAAWADHPSGIWGIGVVGGGNLGNTGVGGDIGLSLKAPTMPIFWAVNLRMSANSLTLRASGDKYFSENNLISEQGFNLDWYLGLGGYLGLSLGNNSVDAALGARLPVGLSWHITKEFELWLALTPSLGLSLNPFYFPAWSVPAEIGFRAWLR